ncbi:hypothetical protein QUB68_24810 [Microcoleus sp. A006_D1]|uniref:hypothetical protein n=1 Tax=Microcoleus sp. A006_D1 TaxID=3055267 RepID=UPI002FD22706
MAQPNQYDAVLGGRNSQPLQGSAVIGITNRYSEPEHRQFCLDMAASQLPVKHYDGRFFWSGPAARVADIQDVLSFTKVKCLWDESGGGFVVYPRSYSPESIGKMMQQLDEENLFPIYAAAKCGASSYKRLVDAFIEVIQVELGCQVVEK